jgi:serine/threonine protein kinase
MALELPEPGQSLGKYKIASQLGEGAMGFVYDAVHRQLGTRVAIKVLKPVHAIEHTEVQRFEREARAAAALTSPHVVRIFDVDVSPSGLPYIVMERLDGRDIANELCSREQIPIDEVVDWALQVCDALADAHRQGIIHRDIKTSNVFLVRVNGKTIAKVLDFGTSKMSTLTGEASLTATDKWVGTPHYMSPEQLRGGTLDGRSDVWAVGVLLYRVFSRRFPFEGDAPGALAIAIATENAVPLGELRPDLPPGLSSAVMRAFEKKPENRHASIDAFAAALAPFGTRSRDPGPAIAKGSPNVRPPVTSTRGNRMGDVIAGKYRLLSQIGEGGMGSVYRAEHLRLGQHVAVKILSQALAGTAHFATRFEREARAAARLRSSYAVRVHDVDVLEDGTPFLVMELLEGNDLFQESKRRSIPLDDLITWILQVCGAIGEAHAQGIIHRDLKPANIFIATVENERIAKVLDFGLSKTTGERKKLTIDGATIGTIQYMSPEQLRAQDVDARTDVYALGAVLYRLLGNKLPHEPNRALEFATGLGPPPVSLATLRPDLPPALCAAIMRTLARHREERPTIDQLAEALAPFAKGRSTAGGGVGLGTGEVLEPIEPSTQSGPVHDEADAVTTENATVETLLAVDRVSAQDDDDEDDHPTHQRLLGRTSTQAPASAPTPESTRDATPPIGEAFEPTEELVPERPPSHPALQQPTTLPMAMTPVGSSPSLPPMPMSPFSAIPHELATGRAGGGLSVLALVVLALVALTLAGVAVWIAMTKLS